MVGIYAGAVYLPGPHEGVGNGGGTVGESVRGSIVGSGIGHACSSAPNWLVWAALAKFMKLERAGEAIALTPATDMTATHTKY